MQDEYTHPFHPYPAKFPARIISRYIEKYSLKGDDVIDPFCGSGTTLVESRLLGRNSLGIDINPIGALISKTKSEKYSEVDMETLDAVIEEITVSLLNPKRWIKIHYQDGLPNYDRRSFWFSEEVIFELNAINSGVISGYSLSNRKIFDLLRTAFSKIIVRVSNQDKETRYARVEKNIQVGDTLKLFLRTLKSYRKALGFCNFPDDSKVSVIEGDTLKELPKIKSDSFDLALTSPPYINSFDYYLYHKHRILLLNKNPKSVRKTEIGGHHTIDSQTYEKAFNNYQDAMKTTFENLHRILKPEKKFILFIGDGVVKGRFIDMAEFMEIIAKQTGFEMTERESIPLKQVSKGFIKDSKIDKKKHHVIIFTNKK